MGKGVLIAVALFLCLASGAAGLDSNTTTYQIPVLVIKYYPTYTCYACSGHITAANASSAEGTPANAIDNNLVGTKWQPNSPYPGDYLLIDFGSPQNITAVTPYFYGNDKPAGYHFSVSNSSSFSGEEVMVVNETNSLTGFISYSGAIQSKTYVFSTVNARYLKLVIDFYRTDDYSGAGQVNLYELQVHDANSCSAKGCLNTTISGMNGYSNNVSLENPVSPLNDTVNEYTHDAIRILNNASIYRGYKNTTGIPSLSYSIYQDIEYFIPVPVLGSLNANHTRILKDSGFDICDYVANHSVKEVWLWMYHTSYASPVESYQTGPYGGVGNGWMDLPVCNSTYTTYDYAYTSGLGNVIEDHTHHLEWVFEAIDFNLWWRDFTGGFYEDAKEWECDSLPGGCVNYNGTAFNRSLNQNSPLHCGWTHCPPNQILADCNSTGLWPDGNKCKCVGYGWFNYSYSTFSDCEDWKPDMSGTLKAMNCSVWRDAYIAPGRLNDTPCPDDSGVAFKVWWMQNLPGRNNGLVTVSGRPLLNWWSVVGDYDSVMVAGGSLSTNCTDSWMCINSTAYGHKLTNCSWQQVENCNAGCSGTLCQRDYCKDYNENLSVRGTTTVLRLSLNESHSQIRAIHYFALGPEANPYLYRLNHIKNTTYKAVDASGITLGTNDEWPISSGGLATDTGNYGNGTILANQSSYNFTAYYHNITEFNLTFPSYQVNSMSYYSETAAEDSCFNTTAVREYTCSDPFSLGSALYACPYGCRSGACISYAANQLPSVSGVTLLSSSGSGLPGDNITVNYTLSDSDNNSVRGIVDWRLSGSSIAVLNMPFDTNSSVSARDYSTYSHDGNLGGGNESRAPKWQRGKVGGAYAFDGIDDFINTTVSNISSQLTVEAWVKLARQMVTFEKQFVVNGYRFSLSLVDGVPQAELSYNPDYVDLYADDALTTGAWYHLALVVDSTNATLYIDGQPVDSSNASAGRYINNSNSGLYIGAANSIGAYYYFNGSIDELRIYNQSLSRQQILADYTAGLANHTSLILVSPQAEVQWTAAVTPNDGLADGTAASSSLTLTTPSPTTQNPGGGSNSPGGSTSSVAPRLAPPSEEAEFNFGLIVPGLEFSSTLGNSFALRRIRIDAIQPLPNTQLIIAKVESLSEPPTGVYQFLNITSNVNFSRVKSLRLEFAVNKSWIRKMGRNLSDIRMARLHSDWEYLNTSLVTQDSIRAYYSAQLTGMSIFAITYQKKEAIVNVTAPAVNQTASEPDQKQPGKPVELYWMSFIAALIVFSLISFSYVTKSILKAKDPFEKLHFAREMLNSGQHQKASEIYASIVYSIDKHNLSPAKRDLLARELNGLYNLLMNKGS